MGKCHALHKTKLEQLDNTLYEWECSEGAPVSGPRLTEKAKDLYQTECSVPEKVFFNIFKTDY